MTRINARFEDDGLRVSATLPTGELPPAWETMLRAVVGEELEVFIENIERGVVSATARSRRRADRTVDGFPRDEGDQEEEP